MELKQPGLVSEPAARASVSQLGGPWIKLGGPQSQLGGREAAVLEGLPIKLGEPWSQLGGPPIKLGEP